MNILFYLHGDCRPEVGGIERVTDILCSYFRKNGYKCFLIYQEEADSCLKRTEFDAYYYLPSNSPSLIAEIIKQNEIDVIINQEEHYITSQIYQAVKMSGRKCRIIYAHHSIPFEGAKAPVAFNCIFENFKKEHRLYDLIKLLLHPIYRVWNLSLVRKQYKETLLKSDVIVMLANCYISQWYKFANIGDSYKKYVAPVIAINNPLNLEVEEDARNLEKEKRVLIVCRHYEPAKRVLLALKIWKEVEKTPLYNEWVLDIVGDGPDRSRYEDYAKRNLKRVTFYGRQNPNSYYKRSSLFMMTSAFEGWGMTLVEAMHYGCVPIVYDSFESLHDIIQSEMSNCIIENGNNRKYLSVLKDLMDDETKRFKLANICKESTKRFSVNQIGEKWITLFNSL